MINAGKVPARGRRIESDWPRWQSWAWQRYKQTFFNGASLDEWQSAVQDFKDYILPCLKENSRCRNGKLLQSMFTSLRRVFRSPAGRAASSEQDFSAQRIASWIKAVYPAVLQSDCFVRQVGEYITEIAFQMRAYARRSRLRGIDPLSNDWALVAAALINTKSVESPSDLKSFGRMALERLGALTAEGRTAAVASELAVQIQQCGWVNLEELLSLVEGAGSKPQAAGGSRR